MKKHIAQWLAVGELCCALQLQPSPPGSRIEHGPTSRATEGLGPSALWLLPIGGHLCQHMCMVESAHSGDRRDPGGGGAGGVSKRVRG